ncbi:hypothetical protein Tsubulata_005164 [Turnera subulata]|uniref:Uncharacterized protein n=1 Tax=Turnera subulata TaxID=218843 RepID=A0A9Q0JL38_9ROSI|nr:hypothetical protein Tsubulata_005161 [Turnera subulata]KAJ4846708.1 hypothetical protein Tsubulata_005164 [Turnera subulata]
MLLLFPEFVLACLFLFLISHRLSWFVIFIFLGRSITMMLLSLFCRMHSLCMSVSASEV